MSDQSTPVVIYPKTKVNAEGLNASEVILCTLNAKYIHASLGLRYLHANMGQLTSFTSIQEYTINLRVSDIAEKLLAVNPSIIGLGVYIWNVKQTTELASLIKTIAPETIIIIGGPEVSYEYDSTVIFNTCDYLITGQADFAFRDLCSQLLDNGVNRALLPKVVNPMTPSVTQLESPYHLYNADDLNNRILYVEASRGCPFKCEFCLSALDKTAWPFELSLFLDDMQALYQRGARQFKFVDRTFNLKVKSCIAILNFFLDRIDSNLFLHFEVIPDKLPDELKKVLQKFPPTTLQFEVGIQSFNPEVQATISRKQDDTRTIENLAWLRQYTNAYIHADLIFGLPGETLQSFAQGFNRLWQLGPQEIQLGILKRLRGTQISRHTDTYQMCYSPDAPYQLVSNRDIDFQTLQRIHRFARYWDLIANSGRFKRTLPLILADNPFQRFWQLSDWIYVGTGQTHRISLQRLFRLVHDGALKLQLTDPSDLALALHADFLATGEHNAPGWLSDQAGTADRKLASVTSHNRRQSRAADTR